MPEALLNACGLHPEDITQVFTTHYHYDHHVSPLAFPNAKWIMPEKELRYLEENNKKPDDFDMIITGDLGSEGLSILGELLTVSGLDVSREGLLEDCGRLIYDTSAQDVHAGGSGCGCSAVTLAAHLLPRLQKGSLRDILFIGTGAMMSPSSTKQGEAIPAVAHLVHLCSPVADKR